VRSGVERTPFLAGVRDRRLETVTEPPPKSPVTRAPTVQSELAAFYDSRYWANAYMDAPSGLEVERVKDVLATVRGPVETVLDFGCGQGSWIAMLRETFPGAELVGIDISRRAIEMAQRRFPRESFRSFDGGDVPFDDESFDLVFSYHVLEHVLDIERTASEMVRVARRGRYICAVFPAGNPDSLEHRLVRLAKRGWDPATGCFYFEDPGHLRRLTTDEVVELFDRHGATLEEQLHGNQLWGAVEFLSKQQPPVVKRVLDARRMRAGYARPGVWILRFTMLGLSPVMRAQLRSDFRERIASAQSTGERAKWIAAVFAKAAGRPLRTALEALARREWRRRSRDSGGSVQYLLFSKAASR
jgi:ubiquinone/menaquinone biosynthesis C-methylase UbiE